MGAPLVVNGALIQCAFGAAPMPLTVLPTNKVMAGNMPAANIMDNKPFVNIPSFVMCKTPSNPAVAAIIASSLGTVTQAPCVPVIPAPWIPAGSPTAMIGNMPALNKNCTCMCAWGGVITITSPGNFTVMVP